MKLLILLPLFFTVACARQTEIPKSLDLTSDMSAQMTSEQELSSTGCHFKKEKSRGHKIECATSAIINDQYAQKIAIFRYEKEAHKTIMGSNIRTPSGQLINEATLGSIKTKWQAAYREVNMPKTVLPISRVKPSFPTLISSEDVALAYEKLLILMLRSNVIVEIKDDLQVSVDTQYASESNFLEYKTSIQDWFDILSSQVKDSDSISEEYQLLWSLIEELEMN